MSVTFYPARWTKDQSITPIDDFDSNMLQVRVSNFNAGRLLTALGVDTDELSGQLPADEFLLLVSAVEDRGGYVTDRVNELGDVARSAVESGGLVAWA